MQRDGEPVAAGASGLLRVGLDRARQIVVHDEADVRLVDAQAERVGRDDGADRLVHEQVVDRRAVFFVQLRVVDGRGDAELPRQIRLHLERVLDRGGIDDAGAFQRAVAVEQRGENLELVGFLLGLARFVHQVRPVEPADDRLDRIYAELVQDVFAHRRGRGGREREHGRMAELSDHAAEREVGGAEVVAPLADAVRLVHDEERNVYGLQQLQEAFVLELLGRRVDDAQRSRRDAFARAHLLIFGEGRVERHDVGDAAVAQHVELILHQRDQRADDDRGAAEQQRRELIGQALTGAGRQNCERVVTLQDTRHDLFLAGVETGKTELLLERCAQIHG